MRTYEVWYDDIDGEHFLGVVKATSSRSAIDSMYNQFSYLASKEQLKAFDVANDYYGVNECDKD